jgi:hypothetical protein
MMPPHEVRFTLEGTWTPAEVAAAGPYRYLPFTMPANAARLDVAYTVTALDPTESPVPLLDIGVFDPGGLHFLGPHGFRGWTGAFRDHFFITPQEATPGYRRGDLAPGPWHILLGAAEPLPPSGCRYTVEVVCTTAEADGPPPARPYPVYEPGVLRAEARWYKGNLHAHTFHSDGANSVEEMAAEHRRWGLDFGAMTDHNLVNPELALGAHPDFLWIPGEEVTTPWGHLNVWGLDQWLDFRCTDLDGMVEIIRAAHQRGAVTSINHPKDDGPDWTFGAFPDTMAFEVWQAPWFLSNYQSLAHWTALLRAGKRPVGIGGSDLHRISTPDHPYPYYICNPTTWVYAGELSIPAILAGIMDGHVFISAAPDGPELYLTVQTPHAQVIVGDETALHPGETAIVHVEVIGGEGRVVRLLGPDGVLAETFVASDRFIYEHRIEHSAALPPFVRADLIQPLDPDVDLAVEPGALWVDAMTNPIWLLTRPAPPPRPVA